MQFAYKRRGGPILDWRGPSPPAPTRAGETRSLGDFRVPRPGAPEVIEGYESPQPNAATIHIGGYIPEGAARGYGQQTIGADAPKPAPFDMGLVRKASALAAGYHGVRRNNGSIIWGLLWAAAAFITPLYGTLVPAFAVAQGFGQAKARSNPARRKRNPARTWGVKVGPAAARRKKHAAWKARRAEIARTKKRKLGGRKTKRMGTRRGIGAYGLR
jgi:hypothetical protein